MRARSHLEITSGSNTGRILAVGILNNSGHGFTKVNSAVIYAMGRTAPNNIIGGNSMIGTIVIHAGRNTRHGSNSCVGFSRGTYMVVHSSGDPHKAHVFKPITHRLHSGGCVGVISLTPRMLWSAIVGRKNTAGRTHGG